MQKSKEGLSERIEHDQLGELNLPCDCMHGIATERALRCSSIGTHKVPSNFIHALALVKYACASANEALGLISPEKSLLIQQVAWEIYEGKWDQAFPVEIFQTGGCTPTNMNVNEVIARIASKKQAAVVLHPNDDCNKCQSTNDVIPTALNIALRKAVKEELLPALEACRDILLEKEKAWASIIKVGRTHTMDAVLMTLGQEFSGYRRQVEKAIEKFQQNLSVFLEVPMGGTAVGNGVNCNPNFGLRVVEVLNHILGENFIISKNRFEQQSSRDDYVFFAGLMDTLATSLIKIANDIRWLGSGPVCGLNELKIPATQAGSSCMPGKINPVVCETLLQACIYAQGNGDMIRRCAVIGGQFQLNTTSMLLIYALSESVNSVAKTLNLFTNLVLKGLEPNVSQLKYNVEHSYAMVTTLAPLIGYDLAANIVQYSQSQQKSVLEVTKNLCPSIPLQHLKDLLEPNLTPYVEIQPNREIL